MSKNSSEDSSRQTKKRIEPFLDCIAYLLAKRWLRDQRQQNDFPSKEETALHSEDT